MATEVEPTCESEGTSRVELVTADPGQRSQPWGRVTPRTSTLGCPRCKRGSLQPPLLGAPFSLLLLSLCFLSGPDFSRLACTQASQTRPSNLMVPCVCVGAWSLQSGPTCQQPYGLYVALQAPLPWDSPGKNTGVGCHFLLQGSFRPRN